MVTDHCVVRYETHVLHIANYDVCEVAGSENREVLHDGIGDRDNPFVFILVHLFCTFSGSTEIVVVFTTKI